MSSRGGSVNKVGDLKRTEDLMSSNYNEVEKVVVVMETWQWRQCVVEPALFLQNLVRILFYATIQDFIFLKACNVDLGYSYIKCSALLNRYSYHDYCIPNSE